jgi:DNA-binding PadR family transcriptional regulator
MSLTINEELALLVCVNSEEVYGLEIANAIKMICTNSGNKKEIPLGSLYQVLKNLEKEKLIISTRLIGSNAGARQYYSITQKGIDAINEMHEMRQRLINWKSPNN